MWQDNDLKHTTKVQHRTPRARTGKFQTGIGLNPIKHIFYS